MELVRSEQSSMALKAFDACATNGPLTTIQISQVLRCSYNYASMCVRAANDAGLICVSDTRGTLGRRASVWSAADVQWARRFGEKAAQPEPARQLKPLSTYARQVYEWLQTEDPLGATGKTEAEIAYRFATFGTTLPNLFDQLKARNLAKSWKDLEGNWRWAISDALS